MNLYQFHNNPKDLDHHDLAHENVPELFWPKASYTNANWDLIKSKKELIAKSPLHALEFAKSQNEPFKLGEKAIATNAEYSFEYALEVLHHVFPLGEKIIATNVTQSYWYARKVLNGSFPLGEPIIAINGPSAVMYSKNVLNRRFELGEPAIKQLPHNDYHRQEYEELWKIKL